MYIYTVKSHSYLGASWQDISFPGKEFPVVLGLETQAGKAFSPSTTFTTCTESIGPMLGLVIQLIPELIEETFSSVDLTPGHLLFVPAGCPHKVENLEDSIAVSGNFVNESNIREAEKHLRISALQDPRAGDLLREFDNLGFL